MNLVELKRAKDNTLATLQALNKLIEQLEASEKPKKRQNKRAERSSKNWAKISARVNKNHSHLGTAFKMNGINLK